MPTRGGEYIDLTPLIETLPNRIRELQVQQFEQSYLIHRLMSAAATVPCFDTIEIPYYISPPTLGRWITKNDILPDATSGQMAMGYESNRYLAIPMSWDIIEQWELEGNPDVMIDRMERMAAEMTWAKWRNFAAAAWSGPGGKQPIGISTAIEKLDPGSQVKVIHGVDKGTEAWFQNGYIQLTSNFGTIAAGSTLPAGYLATQALIDEATVGTYLPTELVTNRDIFKMFKRAANELSTPHHQIQQAGLAKFGFEVVDFDGVPITWDHYCPADTIVALHIGTPNSHPMKVLGDTSKNQQKLDWNFEKIDRKIFNVDSSLGIISHPRVKDRGIAPRSPYRSLQEAKWVVDSFNLFYKRMASLAVADSSGGSMWSTW